MIEMVEKILLESWSLKTGQWGKAQGGILFQH
jgi:hypothetical protein